MTGRRHLALTLGLLTSVVGYLGGCRSSKESTSHSASEGSGAPAKSAPVAQAKPRQDGAQDDWDPKLEVTACQLGASAHEPGSTSRQQALIIMLQCASLIRDASCRNAFIGAVTKPETTPIEQLLTTCSRAYCPKLSDRDGLSACTEGSVSRGLQAQEDWGSLQEAILRHDHGDKGFDRAASALLRASEILMSAPARDAAPTPRAAITIVLGDNGAEVRRGDEVLGKASTSAELARLLPEAKAESEIVEIAANVNVSYERITEAAQIARERGYAQQHYSAPQQQRPR